MQIWKNSALYDVEELVIDHEYIMVCGKTGDMEVPLKVCDSISECEELIIKIKQSKEAYMI